MRSPLVALLKRTAAAVGGRGLGRIKPIRFLYDLVFRILRPSSVMVLGHRLWLDDRDTLELSTREIYEPETTKLFMREIRPGDTVLDIGANIGYFTLLAARLAGAAGRVIAFEPDPANFRILKMNVEKNGYANVTLVDKAVSDRTGNARLYLSATNRGDHRLTDPKDGRKSVAVGTVALDSFLKKLDRKVQFIKMDIQGAEAAALAGMKGLIRSNRGLKLVVEFEPGNLERSGSDPGKVLKTLQKMGFRLSEISEKDRSVKPTSPIRLLNRYTVENGGYTNLYCEKR